MPTQPGGEESDPSRQPNILEQLRGRLIPASLTEDAETRHRAITAVLFFLAPSGVIFYWAAAIIVSTGQTLIYKKVMEQPATSTSTLVGVL